MQPNRWNAGLRWSSDYGTRLNHLMRCDGIIALPGGIGTLTEMAVAWSSSQTEGRAISIVLLGACWPPIIAAIGDHLVVGESDLKLLRFADSPAEALRELQDGLEHAISGSEPHG
jgi:predicted Rossmann-fold nucleotide-binding protein